MKLFCMVGITIHYHAEYIWSNSFLFSGLQQTKGAKKEVSGARVTIGGQYVLLQNSLRIKVFIFFLQIAKITVWITSLKTYFWTPEYIVKVLETKMQSSKNAQKWTKMCKIYDVDRSTLVLVFNSFFVFCPEAKHRKQKKLNLGTKLFKKKTKYCFKCTMKIKRFFESN